MRVVIDTNVFISALMSANGAARSVIRRCLRGEDLPLMSGALFHEYESVIARPGLFEGCRVSAEERSELFDAFLSTSVWTPIWFLWRPNLRDEGDNFLVELAISGAAQCIVTANVRDFREPDLKHRGFAILGPAEYLSWRKAP